MSTWTEWTSEIWWCYFCSQKSKDLSPIQRNWPELVRFFVLFNYLHFTYFLFSLAWKFIKKSLLKRNLGSCCLSNASDELQYQQKEPRTLQRPSHGRQMTGPQTDAIDNIHQHPCKILASLQKLRTLNESLQTFLKEQWEVFYNSLINAYLNFFYNGDKMGTKSKGKVDVESPGKISKEKERQQRKDKTVKKHRHRHYDVYNGIVDERSPFENERYKKYTNNTRRSKEKINCEDCLRIRKKYGIQDQERHKHRNRDRSDPCKDCQVIYYGPYSREKGVNDWRNAARCGPDRNCRAIGKEGEMCKNGPGLHKMYRGKENQYFSEDNSTVISSEESELLGTPLAKIDANDKSFMTNHSVRAVYKEVDHGRTKDRGRLFTKVIRGFSKPAKVERKINRRK